MSIILLRHAVTDSNRRTFAGRRDVPLNREGQAQAIQLSRRLSNRTVHAVLTSPLRRSIQTAKPLLDLTRAKHLVCPGLQEIDFGDLEGTDKSAIVVKLRRDYRYRALPGGESLYDVRSRLRPVMLQLMALQRNGGDVVVVGHYWSCKMLFGLLSGQSLSQSCGRSEYKPRPAQWIVLDLPVQNRA